MNWSKVADYLDQESDRLYLNAPMGFPSDTDTREMRMRAAIFYTFSLAIRAGIEEDQDQ